LSPKKSTNATRTNSLDISPKTVLLSLEENFNGVKKEHFRELVRVFFGKLREVSALAASFADPLGDDYRTPLDVLEHSLAYRSMEANMNESSARFKLVIDETEDNSAARLLEMIGIVDPATTDIFQLSDFELDNTDHEKSSVISAIKIAMERGRTVFLINCSAIHGSFYDLFNQHYLRREDKDHNFTYYANVAIGSYSKPCRVHPNFQCIVHLRASQLSKTPLPFLNRFEKYLINVTDIFEQELHRQRPGPDGGRRDVYSKNSQDLLRKVLDRCIAFADYIGCDSFYGNDAKNATVVSALLSVLDQDQFIHLKQKADTTADTANETAQHWRMLIRVVVSRLLQVATPERIYQKRKLLPPAYVEHYVEKQEHFSLKLFLQVLMRRASEPAVELGLASGSKFARSISAIDNEDSQDATVKEEEAQADKGHASKAQQYIKPRWLGNRWVVYTRLTADLDSLPSSRVGQSHRETNDRVLSDTQIELLEQLVCTPWTKDGTNRVSIQKLETFASQAAMSTAIKHFIGDPASELLLLIVNMQRTPIQLVNFLRQIIDQHQKHDPKKKTFVLLLCFTSVNLHISACYQTLFMRGWDYHYLDSVGGGNTLTEPIPVKSWLQVGCGLQTELEQGEDVACASINTDPLRQLLRKRYDIVVAHLRLELHHMHQVVGQRLGGGEGKEEEEGQDGDQDGMLPFYQRGMTQGKKVDCLRKLMLAMPDLEKALITEFQSLWTPQVISFFLEEANKNFMEGSLSRGLRDNFMQLLHTYLVEVFEFLAGGDASNGDLHTLYEIVVIEQEPQATTLALRLLKLFPRPTIKELQQKRREKKRGRIVVKCTGT
jgi:hypothetical protein